MSTSFFIFLDGVFPADAGMNRGQSTEAGDSGGVPRGRGDEPVYYYHTYDAEGCSPRTRG